MHAILNCEKKMADCLSDKAKLAFKIVTESLASNSLQGQCLKSLWELEVGRNPKYFFRKELGMRFGNKGENSSIIICKLDALKSFCDQHPEEKRLQELKFILADQSVLNEILGLSSVWKLLLNPLWQILRTANPLDSMCLIESFVKMCNIANDLNPIAILLGPRAYNNDCTTVVDYIVQLLANVDEECGSNLIVIIRAMLRACANYMIKLQSNWKTDVDIPHLNNMPFTNQMMEMYFAILDFCLTLTTNCHIFTRLEIAKAIMNKLHTWTSGLEKNHINEIMLMAYRKGHVYKTEAKNSEEMILEYREAQKNAHTKMVC